MIRIGDFIEVLPANSQVRVESQVDFVAIQLDEDDKPIAFLGRSVDREWKAKINEECRVKFEVGEYMHSTIEARPIKPVHEVVSDIPVELDLNDEPLSLQESIKQFCAQMIQHEFGRDSDEVDTFEEMMDYDIPDDDDWMYEEAKEVIPEEPIPQEDPPEPPEEPPQEEETPQ